MTQEEENKLIAELCESVASDLDYYDDIKYAWLKQNEQEFDEELVREI